MLNQRQTERTKFQQEIKRLQSELAATKQREEELAAKIKELGTRPIKTQVNQESVSFWQTIKTPLFYGGGILLIVTGLGWLWSKLEK